MTQHFLHRLSKSKSMVWSFFNAINDEKTLWICIHCDTEIDIGQDRAGGLRLMKKHLLDTHPEALLHHNTDNDPLFVTAGDENNSAESEEENLHEEYLDLEALEVQDNVKIKPSSQRRSSDERRPSFERMPGFLRDGFVRKSIFARNRSFERKPKRPRIYRSEINQNKAPDSIQSKAPNTLEHFTNYITSLLQELPDKISKKLQMDFVKQIIEAQISYADLDNEEAVTTMNGNVVTVANGNASVTVNEDVATTTADTNSGEVENINNGIIIHPIVSSS